MTNRVLKREVIETCMDSPLYFTIPLQLRLQLVKQTERQLFNPDLRELFLTWVKTGCFDFPRR